MLFIIGGKILTMAGQVWERGYLRIEEGKICELGPMEQDCPVKIPEDAQVIWADGSIVMPGLIEAHCHMGITEEKKGREGNDMNENVDPVTPWLRGIDAINTMDAAFGDAVRAGITSAMIGPGSSNVVGGQFVFLKTWGRCIDDLIVLEPAAMKVAFGENPKTNYGDQGSSPVTRMGIAGMLREELSKAVKYREQRISGEIEPDFRYECWLPVLEKRIPLKAHAHRADDIFTAMRIAREFDLLITLDHCTEGHLIAEKIATSGYPAIVGPDLSSRNKIEVQNLAFKTIGILNKAGVKTAVMTDHPISLIQSLPICAGWAVKAGMKYMEALKAVTIYPAEICRVDHRVGSLEVGKDADVAIFDGDPLEIKTKIRYTIINGEIAYMDKEEN
ncbi:MAG: amidohydrolase [Lachnospiraceae bacterium]|jgi:imidazolonepropionase-like amidohydrolase|nr:amidohydrolase [Lachnospiraceae bacterium]